ncbi:MULTISPECIES: hypothetical protein [Kitasatospora]|uniref:hypothetical protein n=1 Tax=Kitasatospora TaxID=2063 RepID=UPI000CBEE82A|nr:hypothetical protein [Kitasatospora sp. GP30]MDH6142419.1 hypothetical protein [Kitasatospora sp. GP30]
MSGRLMARVTAAPAPYPSEHEQAGHELDLAIALVLNAPQAGRSLERLVNSDRIHPEGALVFACLLAVTGRLDPAQFWWQFAAGSGSHTAANLLHLHHLRLGEPRDAAYWRAQAEQLAQAPRRTVHSRLAGPALLPDEVRHDLLARCHEGLDARLPTALEAVINRLCVAADDEDYGEIPQPSTALSTDLAAG